MIDFASIFTYRKWVMHKLSEVIIWVFFNNEVQEYYIITIQKVTQGFVDFFFDILCI